MIKTKKVNADIEITMIELAIKKPNSRTFVILSKEDFLQIFDLAIKMGWVKNVEEEDKATPLTFTQSKRKYEVARNEVIEQLIETVNLMINDGWQPVGGIAVSETLDYYNDDLTTGHTNIWYCQAMIKNS